MHPSFKPSSIKGFLSLLVLSTLSFLMPSIAFALSGDDINNASGMNLNAVGIAPPPDSDVTLQGLNEVFGLVGSSQQFNVLGELMLIWNGSMMFVGSILVGYIIVTGVLKTAQDGEALGKQWNSMLIPFRASLGLAATAPLMAGYSAIQLIVIWCAIQGVGMADMMWEGAVQKLARNGGFVTAPLSNKDAVDINEKIYLSATCMVALNKQIASDREAGSMAITPQTAISARVVDGDILIGDHSDNPVYSRSECGGFEWGFVDKAGANYEMMTATGTNVTAIANTFKGMGDSVIAAQRSAIMASFSTMLPIVTNRISADGVAPTAAQLKPSVDLYTQTIANSVSTMKSFVDSEGLDIFSQDAIKDGWGLAGAYYVRIGHFNSAANEVIKAAPTGIYDEVGYNQYIVSHMDQAKKDIEGIHKELLPGAKNQYKEMTGSGFLASIAHPMLSLQGAMVNAISEGGDPIARTQNFGHMMLDLGYILAAPAVVGEVLSESADKASNSAGPLAQVLSKVGGFVSGLISSLVGILFLGGALLAYVFPMVPYMLMLFAVMSWFTSVFIAVVAAPLWAISHATPDGDEVFGAGRNGYVLLMSVVLRPGLTIIAMFGSMAIMFAMDKILNLGYMAAFSGAQVNSISGIIGLVVGFLLYAVISLILVYGCYRLVQTVPDAILQWVGGRDDDSIGVEQHGDKAGAMVVSMRQQASEVGAGGAAGLAGAKDKGKGKGAGADLASESEHKPGTTTIS